MKKVCIIGCGATGLLLLYNLKRNGILPQQILLIDPTLNGGDLSQKWSTVTSNTVWQQLLTAVPYPTDLPERWKLSPDSPCLLQNYIEYLKEAVKDYMMQTELHSTFAISAVCEEKKWKITLKKDNSVVYSDILLLATGSEPKHLDLPFPTIPLEIALDRERLAKRIQKDSHILVFGTAHSGTLIVKNLVDCGARVTNFYSSQKPFSFDRDGEYDGLKQEAAVIADRILAGEYPVRLISLQDTSALIRHTKNVDAVVYAIGFEARNPFGLTDYDAQTGQIKGYTNAWGFGIAYPNQAPDGIHKDVSIPAFQAHIEKQMPNILSSLRIE